MPRFYVLSGPEIGKTHDAGEGATFGRSPDCAVRLRGNSISRNHAQLEKHGDVWVLVDLGSRNGISKDGARSERIELSEGDVVTLGDVELRFRAAIEAPASPPRPAPAPPKPAATAPPPAPSRDDIELEEIELEDDIGEVEIDFDPDAPPPAVPSQAAPTRAPDAPLKRAEPEREQRAPAAPSAKDRVAERAAAAGIAMPGARKGGGPVELHDAGRPVLQFNQVPDRRGFLVADLAQYPLWVKLAAGLLVVAVFVAIFLFAFRGTSMLKGDGGGGAEVVEDEPLD